MGAVSVNRSWVVKFGGTSLATYSAMLRCVNIIASYPQVRIVVVSAPAGVTNLLARLSQAGKDDTPIFSLISAIKLKIHDILADLPVHLLPGLNESLDPVFQQLQRLAEKLKQQYCRQLADELLAQGEQFSARIFSALLTAAGQPAIYQDARNLIRTNAHHGKAEVLIPETKRQVRKVLEQVPAQTVMVTEGFIGSTEGQVTTTLGRGGSDYSAALLAEAMDAEVLQIWTDVSGIYTADPRLVIKARPIDQLSFNAAAELATFGAKVLHPATLWPAIRKNIPVYVGSSMDAKAQGTWIRAIIPGQPETSQLHAISLRRNQSLLTITSLEMLQTHGFLARIFSILANHGLSVDLVTTSEVSVALTLNHSESDKDDLLTPEILAELQTIGTVSLKIDRNLSLVALVGSHLHQTSGISGKVFGLLRSFNIRLINHGASSHNLCFLVQEAEAPEIVRILHAAFFE